jgi:predicted DCC family thiol-disulfide oxidoreductase YuxK
LDQHVPHFSGDKVVLGGIHASARLLRICPLMIRDYVYDPIARNRYARFGGRFPE